MTFQNINLHRLILVIALGISVGLTVGCAKDNHDHSKHKDNAPKKDDHSNHDHSKHDEKGSQGSTDLAPGNQVAATQKQIAAYPVNTCIISDEELGDQGKVIEHMHNGQLVRMCCKGCIKDFNKDPAKYLAKIEAAKKAGAKKGG